MRWLVGLMVAAAVPAMAQEQPEAPRETLEIDLEGLQDAPEGQTEAQGEVEQAPAEAPQDATPPAEAAPAETPSAEPPTCTAPEYSHFDFLIGEWEVTTPDGRVAGTNRIEKSEDGCALRENWAGVSGSFGNSLSYWDPKAKMWQQIWVNKDAIIAIRGAIYKADTLMMGGSITYQANGSQREFVGRWTKQADGSVRQELFEKKPGSTDYSDWFTGIYRKKG